MINEKGLSLIEVIWTILIIASIVSTTTIYQLKFSNKIKNNIIEKVLLTEYIQIVEIFKQEYESFDEMFMANNTKEYVYTINKSYLKQDLTLKLNFHKSIYDKFTKYELIISFPNEFKESKNGLFSDKVETIIK